MKPEGCWKPRERQTGNTLPRADSVHPQDLVKVEGQCIKQLNRQLLNKLGKGNGKVLDIEPPGGRGDSKFSAGF